MQIMRASIIIVFAFATGIVMALSKNHNYSHFVKHHARPRVIRGFKPQSISTAYGFGKRESNTNILKLSKREQMLPMLLQYFSQGIPVERMFQQMKTNPAFNTKLTQLPTDEHVNLMSILDHSKPKDITWLC